MKLQALARTATGHGPRDAPVENYNILRRVARSRRYSRRRRWADYRLAHGQRNTNKHLERLATNNYILFDCVLADQIGVVLVLWGYGSEVGPAYERTEYAHNKASARVVKPHRLPPRTRHVSGVACIRYSPVAETTGN